MKKIVRSITVVALLVATFAFGAQAQTAQTKGKDKLKAILTTEQLATLKENHKKHKEASAAFKATLTDEQKAVLADKSLPHKERKAKLAATLTPTQKQALAANRASAKATRKAFVATLSDKQKEEMKNLHKERRAQDGTKHRRAEKV